METKMGLAVHFIILMALVFQEVFTEKCNISLTEAALKPNEKPFPLMGFLDAIEMNSSAIQWEGFQCKRWLKEGECRCHDDCQSSGDCCIDFLWNRFAFNDQSLDKNIKNYENTIMESSKSLSCQPLFPFDEEIKEYYIMVDSCWSGANETDVERCVNSSSNAQVDQMAVLGDDKYLYKNKFCAQCNGIYTFRTNFVDLFCSNGLSYYDSTIELLKKSDRQCFTKAAAQMDENFVLKCVQKRCNPLDATLCRILSSQFLYDYLKDRKNPFCHRCIWDLPELVRVGSRCMTGHGDGGPGGPDGSWSRVIDLNDFKKSSCGKNTIRGLLQDCERKICAPDQALMNGKCQYCGIRMKIIRGHGNENDECRCDLYFTKVNSDGDCVCKEGSYPLNEFSCACQIGRQRLPSGDCVCKIPETGGLCRCPKDQIFDSTGQCVCKPEMISTPDYKCVCPFDREKDPTGEYCACKKGSILQSDGTCINDTRPIFKTSRGNAFQVFPDSNGNCTCPRRSIRRKQSNNKCSCMPDLKPTSNNECVPNKIDSLSYKSELKCLKKVSLQFMLYAFIEGMKNYTLSVPVFRYMKANWRAAEKNGLMVLQSTDFSNDPNWETNLFRETQSNPNITKAVVARNKNHLLTHMYGFDLIRTFDRYRLCAKYKKINIKSKQTCHEAFNEIPNSKNGTLLINIIATFEKGKVREEVYHCEQFHLQSTCIRENIFPSIYNISNNGTLIIRNSEQKGIGNYSAEKYIPLERGFQICRVENSAGETTFQKFPWMKAINTSEYYISLIGTIFSLLCYIAFLVVFAKIKTIRNRGAFYVMVLVIFLLISDILFIITAYIESETVSCKWFGIIFYWSMLNVLFWSVIVAIDITLQFTKTFSRPSSLQETITTLRKRSGITILISFVITFIIVGLTESDTIDFHFERRCWFGDFYLSLGFYFIPAIVGYVLCFVCLCIVLRSIRKKQLEVQQTLNTNSKKETDLLKIGIKLMLILGTTELFGLIQIKNDRLTENELIFNSTFRLLYVLLRSFRGVFIFIAYMINAKIRKLIKGRFTKTLERYELSIRTQTSSVYT